MAQAKILKFLKRERGWRTLLQIEQKTGLSMSIIERDVRKLRRWRFVEYDRVLINDRVSYVYCYRKNQSIY